jgi:hypothetical protein
MSGSGPSITNPANAVPMWSACSPAVALTASQQTTTAAAVRMATFAIGSQVTIHANKANAADVAIGPSGVSLATGFLLSPGEFVTLPISNVNLLYLIGANTSDKVSWIGF